MILDFKQPELSQKGIVDQVVREQDIRMCDQSFGNLFCWAGCYRAELAVWKESFVSRWGTRISVPLGPQRREMLESLMAGGTTRFLGIDEAYKEWMEQTFPGRFVFRPQRDSADYIYDRQSLETLKGKKLAAKRNHINYFEQAYRWEIRPLGRDTLEDVNRFNNWWCAENACLQNLSLRRESCAVRRGLDHFEQLGYRGIVLYADGKICAFTFGERLGREGFCVHVEKADAGIRGAYPMVNRELIKTLPAEIQWINREDDAGDAGLRKAKLSYHPAVLLMKYEAEVQE